MNDRIDIYRKIIDSKKQSLQSWHIPDVEKQSLISILDDLGLGKI